MPVIESEIQDGLLTVRQSPDGDRIRIALEGELDLSNSKTVETPLREAIASGRDVLIDLDLLTFIDSTGISLLVMALREKEGGLSFVRSQSPEVRRLLDLTGLDERMEFELAEEPEEELPRVLPAA